MPTAATVLLLDNLTSGPAVALAHGEYRKEAAEQLCSLLPEDKVYDRNYPEEQRQRNLLALFPRGMMLSCGRVEKGEFVVDSWKSGELFMYYHDWLFHKNEEWIFDCDSSGTPHKHCMDVLIAEKV